MQESGHAVDHHFRQAADVRRHHRHAARHRLERRQSEAFLQRRQQEQIRHRQQPDHVLRFADQLDVRGDAQLVDQLFGPAQFRSFADDQQPRRARALGSARTRAPPRRPA